MAPTRLRIDTSVGAIAGPSSAVSASHADRLSASSQLRSAKSMGRLRSASSASASSSTSIPSRALHKMASTATIQSTDATLARANATPSASHPWNHSDHSTGASPTESPSEYVLAMHDFAPQQGSTTCLSFRAGQVIHVLNRDSSGWWDGELDGRRGWFPSNYVTSDVGLLTEEELPQASVSAHFRLRALCLYCRPS